MPSIKPIINLITRNSGKLATSFVQRPQFTRITPESLKTLRPALDEVCLSFQKKVISLDEVKALFPTGKLDENYKMGDILNDGKVFLIQILFRISKNLHYFLEQ